jgi:hypothetical protein
MELGRLREFFTSDAEPTPVVRDNELKDRPVEGADQQFARNPDFLGSRRSKDALTGGKPIRFEGSRKFTAVVLIVALMMAGYGAMIGFGQFLKYLDDVRKQDVVKKEAIFARAAADPTKAGKSPKPKSLVLEKTKPAAPGPPAPRTAAGQPMEIDKLEVCVTEAREGIFDQFPTERRLAITLRVKNLSDGPMKHPRWSHRANGTSLRDQTPSMNLYPLVADAAETESVLKIGESASEVLIFSATPSLFGLQLDLPLFGGDKAFRFDLPVGFVQRTQ